MTRASRASVIKEGVIEEKSGKGRSKGEGVEWAPLSSEQYLESE